MELAEVEQDVTEFLLYALKLSKYPTAGMAYCRQATECITHNLHYQEFGEFPKQDEKGNYPSLAGILTKVKHILERQPSEVLYSINAQSRGSLHWDFESRGRGAKKHHVEAVVNQICNTFNDIYGKELALTGMNISDEELREGIEETVGQKLSKQGFTADSKPSEDEVDTDDLVDILSLAEVAEERGVSFDPWEYINLGNAARLRGRTSSAERYYREAMRLFLESGDRLGEGACLTNLGNIAASRGEYDEAERLYNESLAIKREIGDRKGEANSLHNLGDIAASRGEYDEAERQWREHVRIYNEIGIPLADWFVENGYTNPDADWDFPPKP